MEEQDVLFLLSFLIFLLRIYFVNQSILIDPKLKNELTSIIIKSPMLDRDRNVELFESRVLENSEFIRDMCVSMLLLGISTGLFFRALFTERHVAPIADQNRENPAQENPIALAQQDIAVQQDQQNRATFFQSPSASSSNAETTNDFNSKADDGPNNIKKTR
ncbi:MAG: hypothetical protein WAL30_00660 [Candidatus Aquirickettsiella sp.]